VCFTAGLEVAEGPLEGKAQSLSSQQNTSALKVNKKIASRWRGVS